MSQTCACGDHAFAVASKAYVLLVSPEDEALLAKKWRVHLGLTGLVESVKRKLPKPSLPRTSTLCRVIAAAPNGIVVDHINRDPLDNRRPNLRLCTIAENSRNRRRPAGALGVKGVTRHRKKFRAQIKVDRKTIVLGSFETVAAAHEAYCAAAVRLHGEFASFE